MPRVATAPTEQSMPSVLVASATRMTGANRRIWRRTEGWQRDAWKMYDLVGELRFAANWVGNVLSRATFHSARRTDTGLEKVTSGPAYDFLSDLFSGPEGQAQMAKSIGIHLFVAGECYIVGRAPSPEREEKGTDDIWEVISVEEMRQDGKRWLIDYDDGLLPLVLSDEDVVIRVWIPHPKKKMAADSPVRAQLANLRELLLLSRYVSSQATSRIAGAGVLFLPSEIDFPRPTDQADMSSASAFMQVLGEAMLESIDDPGSPANVVPTVVTASGEHIANVRHLTFWTEFDDKAPDMRNEAIRRLALGLDIPPEVMLGTADMNHWSAWQVEESSIKIVVEPMLESIVNALTIGGVREMEGADSDDVIAFDTAQLRLRPNRSKEALELFDRVELSAKATRRETGFDEDDAPTDDERRQRLLMKLADGSSNPEQVAAAYEILGIVGIPGDSGPVREARPNPSLEDHPTRDLPEQNPAQASIIDKSEVLVFRALERAGNRLRSKKQMRPPVAAADTYKFVDCGVGDLDSVLEDAWTCLPRVMPLVNDVQRTIIASALDTYCRHLLLNKRDYSRADMEHYLTSVPIRELVS